MIVSILKLNKNGNPFFVQNIDIVCDNCSKEYTISYNSQMKGKKKYGYDLCRGCKQKEQVKNGIRSKQYINAGISAIKRCKGKKIEELYGEEKAKEMKERMSINSSGENNPNYGKGWNGINPAEYQKGKTYEELYGDEKAKNIKHKLSAINSGENNNMYGKPSPRGSGNGWSGWYNGWFFRSISELSYMIYVIERFNIKWSSAENKLYKIEYNDYNGSKRNYFADFVLNNKYLIEIKPKKLHNTITNTIKKEYAIDFCTKNNMIYKMIDPIKKISHKELKYLVDNGEVKFLDRYKEKYNNYKNKNINK